MNKKIAKSPATVVVVKFGIMTNSFSIVPVNSYKVVCILCQITNGNSKRSIVFILFVRDIEGSSPEFCILTKLDNKVLRKATVRPSLPRNDARRLCDILCTYILRRCGNA